MLSLPQPASAEKNKAFALDVISLPSVQLSENAQVIDLLLRYSYPVSNPRNGVDLDALVSVLSASEKYEMYFVREEVELLIKKSYAKDPRYCMLYLHRSFGHRSKLEFAHYALTCLEYPLVSLVKGRQVNSPENLLPTLIEYHQAASLKIGEYISSYTYTKSKQPVNSRTIRFPGPYEGIRSYPNCPFCSWGAAGTKEPQWFKDSLVLIVNNVYKEGPLSERILPSPSECPSICAGCRTQLPESWNMFKDHFYGCILTEVMKVHFIITIV